LCDLRIANSGSDLSFKPRRVAAQQGELVTRGEAACVMVNWDDDAEGNLNAVGVWVHAPEPDLDDGEAGILKEDTLAHLVPVMPWAPAAGTMELRVSGDDADAVKLWRASYRGTSVALADHARSWDLAVPADRASFQEFLASGYWIEGIAPGTKERGVRLSLGMGGRAAASDATVVMVNLGNAAYREMYIPTMADRGHAALVTRFIGRCSKASLSDERNFLITEMGGPRADKDLSTITAYSDGIMNLDAFGCFWTLAMTHVDRLEILTCADYRASREGVIGDIRYEAGDAVYPQDWDGTALINITGLRCDGLVEVCNEFNGVMLWGKVRTPDSGTIHYNLCEPGDEWTWNEILGTWTHESNGLPDTIEEHNDWDWVDFSDTLMPSTQCGYVLPIGADTRMVRWGLCVPIGASGGN
jgi:hypothetical protein